MVISSTFFFRGVTFLWTSKRLTVALTQLASPAAAAEILPISEKRLLGSFMILLIFEMWASLTL